MNITAASPVRAAAEITTKQSLVCVEASVAGAVVTAALVWEAVLVWEAAVVSEGDVPFKPTSAGGKAPVYVLNFAKSEVAPAFVRGEDPINVARVCALMLLSS